MRPSRRPTRFIVVASRESELILRVLGDVEPPWWPRKAAWVETGRSLTSSRPSCEWRSAGDRDACAEHVVGGFGASIAGGEFSVVFDRCERDKRVVDRAPGNPERAQAVWQLGGRVMAM